VGYVVGPLMAGLIGSVDARRPLWVAIMLYGISAVIFIGQQLVWRGRRAHPVVEKHIYHEHTFKQEWRLWRSYGQVLWPLLALTFMIVLLDATFFSIGPVFGESLAQLHGWGGLFITMYTVPSVLMGMFTGVLARPFGKKRVAFIAGIMAGLGMIAMSQFQSVPLILLTTFIGSCGLSVMFPELSAAYQDYVTRSPHSGNDLIGLTAIAGSSAYILGPLLSGWLSDHIGAANVFGLWGIILVVMSLAALVLVPRKIRLPQYELSRVLRRRH
jgi:MFS family permease